MNNKEKITSYLRTLLYNDYHVKYGGENDFSICLAFNHLNSMYNGVMHVCKNDDSIYIDWQYHRKNKAVEKTLAKLGESIRNEYKYNKKFVLDEIEFFSEQAKQVFEAKYSLKIQLR